MIGLEHSCPQRGGIFEPKLIAEFYGTRAPGFAFDPVPDKGMEHAAEETLATAPSVAEITGEKDRAAQISRLLGTDKVAPPKS